MLLKWRDTKHFLLRKEGFMGNDYWNQLLVDIELEVKKKIRNFRNFSHDLIDESVSEVIQNVYGHYVSGKFTNQEQLCRHAENHVINAIRKIKRLYYRDRNVLEFIKDDIKLYDLGLPIETIALEGIRHLSASDLKIARELSMGFSQADLLKRNIVSSRRQLRKSIHKIKPFLT